MGHPVLIDAHSHINFSAYKDDAAEVITRAESEGVWMLAVGSQVDTSRRAVEYAERFAHIWAVVGLHPIHLVDTHVDLAEVGEEGKEGIAFRTRAETFDLAAYRTLAEHPKTVAIGECGMDFYRIPDGCNPEEVRRVQEQTLRQQIALAQELDLPLMVHVRDANNHTNSRMDANLRIRESERSAHEETIRILTETYGSWSAGPLRGMIHCYSGTWDQAQRYLAIGFNISFTGVITFRPTKKQLGQAEELWRVVREVPMDRFLVETDCPYLTPDPHRGERNEPRYVRHVAERVAELKGISFSEAAASSVENTFRIFRKIQR
ncbi:TatD family hydrolase [Candidatus Uhrbacteria bacterium]|nr:TatD family hydrolase [Candidatus Uhrbacteria bacterium]